MTCVVGLRKDGRVYIGADTAGSAGQELLHRKDTKVFLVSDLLFGFAGSYRMGQVLRYHFTKPKHPPAMDTETYMHKLFIPAVIKLFSEHGVLHKKEELARSVGLFLVGYQGRLFCIDYDFQVGEPHHAYHAIGSGGRPATGALYIENLRFGSDIDPDAALTNALRAAAYHTTSVAGPFTLMVTP